MLRFRPKTYKDLGEKYSCDERALGYIGYDDDEKECGFIVFYLDGYSMEIIDTDVADEDAETYDEISGIADDLQNTLDGYSGTGDYSDYSQRAGDISSGAETASDPVKLSEIRFSIARLEKELRDLEARVDSLRDYNELMIRWEREVETRLKELEDLKDNLGCGWEHQVNGFTLKTGTVNFVTEAK